MILQGARVLCGVILLFFVSPEVRGDDLDGMRAVFEQDIRLFNAHNNNAFVASAHDEVVLFGIRSPFATTEKKALQELVRQYFDDHLRITFRPVDLEFLLVGTSALAWGSYTITEHPKIGPRESIHGRYTFTYTKVNGQWFLAALHLSPLQGY